VNGRLTAGEWLLSIDVFRGTQIINLSAGQFEIESNYYLKKLFATDDQENKD
jgi:hypothetical protein